jgi:hypothetical protein
VSNEQKLDYLLSKDEIREVIQAYCRGIDRLDRSLIRSLFHADARLYYGAFEGNVDAFIDYACSVLVTIGPTAHNITNCLISVDRDIAISETYAICVHSKVRRDDDLIDWVSGVRYLDRHERRSGRWRILLRHVVFDWEQRTAITENWPPTAQPRSARDGTDMSYSLASAADEWPARFRNQES